MGNVLFYGAAGINVFVFFLGVFFVLFGKFKMTLILKKSELDNDDLWLNKKSTRLAGGRLLLILPIVIASALLDMPAVFFMMGLALLISSYQYAKKKYFIQTGYDAEEQSEESVG